MPTLNKLEYLDETKGLIKSALNTKFNSGIQDTDTFRSYVGKIKDIYTNWTKVTGEGTSLTLNGTKKGKMVLDLKGNTSQNSEPTPESPQDVHVVTGDNDIKIENKNLFDKVNTNWYRNNSANWGKHVNSSSTRIKTQEFTLEANKTYTVSGYPNTVSLLSVRGFDSEYNVFESNKIVRNGDTFTLTSDIAYIFLLFGGSDFTDETNILMANANIQIEEGTEPTSYIEHQEQTYQISLGSLELCKIGNYQDYIYKSEGNWYKHSEIVKVVLNGSELWSVPSNITGTPNYYYQITNLSPTATATTVYSNRYPFTNVYTSNTNQGIYVSSSSLRIRYGNEDTVANFKEWLSNNNITVYYVLSTSTDTQITDTTLISQLEAIKSAMSYDTQTNITQTNDDLGFIISASALMKGGN